MTDAASREAVDRDEADREAADREAVDREAADRADPAPRFAGIDALLDDARSRLRRLSPKDALEAVERGAGFIVDIRPFSQRVAEGEIPGSLIVERNHLEWRLDPGSDARLEQARPGAHWIVVCSEGYTSSLAADSLNSIGVDATDVEGGFQAWAKDGLPSTPGGTEAGWWVVPTGGE